MTEDRTPTLGRLEQLKRSLDTVVAFLYQEVPIASLDKYAIIRVMQYMGINFSQERPDSFKGYERVTDGLLQDVIDYDIGYRLMKNQIERDLQYLLMRKECFLMV